MPTNINYIEQGQSKTFTPTVYSGDETDTWTIYLGATLVAYGAIGGSAGMNEWAVNLSNGNSILHLKAAENATIADGYHLRAYTGGGTYELFFEVIAPEGEEPPPVIIRRRGRGVSLH